MIDYKMIAHIETATLDVDLKDDPLYWFTFKNSRGDIINIFKGRMSIYYGDGKIVVINSKMIKDIVQEIPSSLMERDCLIKIICCDKTVVFYVDTRSDQGQYLDIFPIHKLIKRRFILDRQLWL